jgi:serine/threonine protein kinase
VQAGTELAGRYVLVKLLGHGAMGQVWRATDQVLDCPVAVKVISERHANSRPVAPGNVRTRTHRWRRRQPDKSTAQPPCHRVCGKPRQYGILAAGRPVWRGR